MHGLHSIRNINAAAVVNEAARARDLGYNPTRDQSEDRVRPRYQVQYKGNEWAVYDTHTNGWGITHPDSKVIEARVDELNASPAHTSPLPAVIKQAQDLNEAITKD